MECRKDVKQCSRQLLIRLVGRMAYIAKVLIGFKLLNIYNTTHTLQTTFNDNLFGLHTNLKVQNNHLIN